MDIEAIRAVVADGLEARDIGLASWRQDIREGRRDDNPFMVGAILLAERTRNPAE